MCPWHLHWTMAMPLWNQLGWSALWQRYANPRGPCYTWMSALADSALRDSALLERAGSVLALSCLALSPLLFWHLSLACPRPVPLLCGDEFCKGSGITNKAHGDVPVTFLPGFNAPPLLQIWITVEPIHPAWMVVPAATLALTNTNVPAQRATRDRIVKSVSVRWNCWAAVWQLIPASFWWLVLDALYEKNSICSIPSQGWVQRSSLSYSCFIKNIWCLWASAFCSLGRSLRAALSGCGSSRYQSVCWWG